MGLKTDYTITVDNRDFCIVGSYLYVAGPGDGLAIYEVTTPTSPVLKSTFADVLPTCVAVSGDLAIIPEGDAGMVTLDVTDRENPAIIAMDYEGFNGGTVRARIVGTMAYVLSANAFYTYDISDPETPTRLDSVNIQGSGKDLAISGDYAYVVTASASGEAAALSIISIADPANISVTGKLNLTSTGQGVSVSGNYAYVGDGSAGLDVIDVSTPASPTLYANLPTTGALYAVTISGDYAYATGYDAGLLILDIEDPSSPAEVDTLDLDTLAYDIAVSGDYAYVGDNFKIYIVGISIVEAHTITATAGSHGSISPSGEVAVDYGEDQAFTITPDSGWSISNVLVDDVSVGAVASYTFEDVAADHTIHAKFKGRFEEIRAVVTKGTEIRATVAQRRKIRAVVTKGTEIRAKVRINIKEHEA